MTFSERLRYKAPAPLLEERELPGELRNCIWNEVFMCYFIDIRDQTYADEYSSTFSDLSIFLRHTFFKMSFDDRPYDPESERKFFRSCYFKLQFPAFYDFLEVMASDEVESIYQEYGRGKRELFTNRCNKTLEQERACFRFISNRLVRISNEEEMAEVEMAAFTDEAGIHIHRAIELYRDRENPDYRNSVKESVSAVEATYRRVAGKNHKNIGEAIAEMAGEGIYLPPSLKAGFAAIYGWASGKDGIRHALMEDADDVTEAEARLILVMCSAYVNYLLSLYERSKE